MSRVIFLCVYTHGTRLGNLRILREWCGRRRWNNFLPIPFETRGIFTKIKIKEKEKYVYNVGRKMFKTNVRIFEQSRYARFIVKFQTPLPVRPHSSGAIHGWLEPTNLQFGRGGNVLNLITVNTLALLKRYSVCNRLHERIILRNEKVSWKKKKSSWNEIYFFTRLYFHEKISFMYLIYNSRLTFYYSI